MKVLGNIISIRHPDPNGSSQFVVYKDRVYDKNNIRGVCVGEGYVSLSVYDFLELIEDMTGQSIIRSIVDDDSSKKEIIIESTRKHNIGPECWRT